MSVIKIKTSTLEPTEDVDRWSYPISELDYLLETRKEGESFLLYKGRLYEEDNDIYLQSVVDASEILCGYCEEKGCDSCQVAKLGNDAEHIIDTLSYGWGK